MLKIVCPHCRRVLTAEMFTIGEQRLCPACNSVLTVPIPVRAQGPQRAEVRRCVKCQTEIGYSSAYCQKCYTDQRSGQKLTLMRRLALGSLSAWGIAAGVLILVAVVAGVGYGYYAAMHRETIARHEPPPPKVIDAEMLATRLFAAQTPAERKDARFELEQAGSVAVGALVNEVRRSLAEGTKASTINSQRTALEVLTAIRAESALGDSELGVLKSAGQVMPLHGASIRARAVQGDVDARTEILELWLRQSESLAAVDRLIELTPPAALHQLPAFREALYGEWSLTTTILKRIVERRDWPVLEPIGDAYWKSWSWLGQTHGEYLSRRIFELAKPANVSDASGSQLGFNAEEIRGGRRAIQQMSDGGSAAAQAAAMVVLFENTPQYETLRNTIRDALIAKFATLTAREQQLVVWALARISDRKFAGQGVDQHPSQFDTAAMTAVMDWARKELGLQISARALQECRRPPELELSVVSASRQLESALIAQFGRDAKAAEGAIVRWVEAGIGWTPRLDALLDPGQRSPHLPALSAAITLAGITGDSRVRSSLQLWRRAEDQPAAVRGLAYTALGILDAREHTDLSGWPAGLSLGDERSIDTGAPGWANFGALLASGGDRVIERLWSASPSLPAAQLEKLALAIRREQDAGRFAGVPK